MNRSSYYVAGVALALVAGLLCIYAFFRGAPILSVAPAAVFQGDPVMVTINSAISIERAQFDGKPIPVLEYVGTERAFIGIPLDAKPGDHVVDVRFTDGSEATTAVTVLKRFKPEEPLGVPFSLGGNTAAGENGLMISLAKDNRELADISSDPDQLWTRAFQGPLSSLTVTDPYGYDRSTGPYTITHKGTDFMAPIGTLVYAMNDGVVKVARSFTVYGGTVVIDHGEGLQTFYMHLSKLFVRVGQRISLGESIGLSGETGDAEGPHLHLTIRINGVSIDPLIFLGFFGITPKATSVEVMSGGD